MVPLPEHLLPTTILETAEPTSTVTHTPARFLPLQHPDTTTEIAQQDLPLAPATQEAQDPPTTPPIAPTAEVTQDHRLLQTLPTAQVAAIQDLLTAALLTAARATEAVAIVHTQDLPAAAQAALPTATQDPPTALPVALAAEVAAVHTQDLPAAVLPAATPDPQAVREAPTQEVAVHQEAPIQAAEAQEEAPPQAEDKFRIQNPKYKSISFEVLFF